MAEEKRIYKWYLILAIIYSSISILTGIIFFIPNLLLPIGLIWGPVIFIWFILNIVMFILIFVKKIEKIALLLPGLYIFDQIFSLIAGIVLGIVGVAKGADPMTMVSSPIAGILGLIFPVIILIIAIKLILRK